MARAALAARKGLWRRAVRVLHLSTLHDALDVRIFHRECRTLAAAGFDVHYLVQDPPAERLDGIRFHRFRRPEGATRPGRVARRLALAYQQAAALRADVYHFHDPELIPVGLLLVRDGARVIYDVHENAPQEALTLNKGHPWRGQCRAWTLAALEELARRGLHAFVCATPAIARLFPPARTITLQNFPHRHEMLAPAPLRERLPHLVYAGGISAIRGIREMVRALEGLPPSVRLQLAGSFAAPQLLAQVQSLSGWRQVDYRGQLGRGGVQQLLARARLGLVLYHPEQDHLDAQPNKLFEYMAAGLPVIASDFPLWRRLVADAGCGLVVDPLAPRAIAAAARYLLDHPAEAEAMGQRGRAAVAACYNWEAEATKLLGLYRRLGVTRRAA
jgi:glycosyltransferase involved in cell wall biosynthesis